MTHSTLVTKRAVRICDLHPELSLDRQFVIEAAMLHDIGIFKCNAPGIYCFGSERSCYGQKVSQNTPEYVRDTRGLASQKKR